MDTLLNQSILELNTNKPEETQELGKSIGGILSGGEAVLLIGELGTGKTTLTQGIAKGLGIEEYTKSPTFVLVHEYQGRLHLNHIDLYRIEGDLEAWDIGIEEYLTGNGVSVIEWADRAPRIYPDDRLIVELDSGSDTERRFRITGEGQRSITIVNKLKEMSFD